MKSSAEPTTYHLHVAVGRSIISHCKRARRWNQLTARGMLAGEGFRL
jgi:hypothetical protein